MPADMDLWGVNETGFYRPTIEDIKNAKNALAKQIFGEDFDTDELTPEGMYFRINSAAESKLCEIAEGIYYSIFPHTAKGVSLDRVCEGVNLQRSNAQYAEHQIRVFGTQDYIIEAGTEFKTPNGIEFYSVMNESISNVIDIEGAELRYFADIIVQCKERGTVGNVSNITSTVEVNPNIQGIQYGSVVAWGTEAESDAELREKFEAVVQGLGMNTRSSIIANVLRVAGVNSVMLIDNNKTEDKYIPSQENPLLTVEAGTYAVVVHSDSLTNEEEIAQAIFEKQPLGVAQSGSEEVIIKDESNTEHIVKFTYVATNTVNVAVTCNVDNTFSGNGIQEIKDNITAYINGLGIGEEVIYTKLYDCMYNVTGVKKVASMTLNQGTDDVAINEIEIAKVGTISVTVTEG